MTPNVNCLAAELNGQVTGGTATGQEGENGLAVED